MTLSPTIQRQYSVAEPVAPLDDLRLARASVLAQLSVVCLSVARVAADVASGRLGIEGGIALALVLAFVVPLTRNVIQISKGPQAVGRPR